MDMKRTWFIGVVGIAASAIFVAGCSQPSSQNTRGEDKGPANKEQAKAEGDHGHKPGQHGGSIVEIGRDNYHAEAVFGDKGLIRLYMLAKDEAKIQEVEEQTLVAYAKAEGDTRGVEVKFEPKPRPDDAKGKTSVFEGTLPKSLRDKRVEVTVTTIRIEGGRFRFGFKNFREQQHGSAAMPAPLSNEKMKQLYATAKGKYTEADIKANGPGKTALDVYGNEMTEHDDNPQPGDKICPISMTKANPKITWVVSGKKYEFCCTPCINEFVKKAQEKPDQIKEPEDYVKK
jgi:hypothetical protein